LAGGENNLAKLAKSGKNTKTKEERIKTTECTEATELIFKSFSAIILSNSKLLEKHRCFSKSLLLLRKPGGETAG
jgi:hypothetical protein